MQKRVTGLAPVFIATGSAVGPIKPPLLSTKSSPLVLHSSAPGFVRSFPFAPKTLAAAAYQKPAQMGGKCPHRKVKKRRLSHKTARRGKFLLNADDAVYDELVKLADQGKDSEGKTLPVDEDLPGMGQFYCLHCDRYFADESVKEDHYRSKRHKKRVKQLSGPAPHTQLDADLAAGMGMPDNGLKLMST